MQLHRVTGRTVAFVMLGALLLVASEAERLRRCERRDACIRVASGTSLVHAAIMTGACGGMAARAIARGRVMVGVAPVARRRLDGAIQVRRVTLGALDGAVPRVRECNGARLVIPPHRNAKTHGYGT